MGHGGSGQHPNLAHLASSAVLGVPLGYPSPPFCSPAGTQTPTKKPRSRSILQSLFCCLCRDEGEPCTGTTGAPLLVEENGALPKVTPHPSLALAGMGYHALHLPCVAGIAG